MQNQIIQIIAGATLVPVAELTLDKRLDDLGVDSLGLVETIFALEEAFDIKVPFNVHDGAAQGVGFDVSTIGSIVAGVQALLHAAQAA